MLHQVALQLELDDVTGRLDAGFGADAAAGKLARLPEIIREARAAIRARTAIAVAPAQTGPCSFDSMLTPEGVDPNC